MLDIQIEEATKHAICRVISIIVGVLAVLIYITPDNTIALICLIVILAVLQIIFELLPTSESLEKRRKREYKADMNEMKRKFNKRKSSIKYSKELEQMQIESKHGQKNIAEGKLDDIIDTNYNDFWNVIHKFKKKSGKND